MQHLPQFLQFCNAEAIDISTQQNANIIAEINASKKSRKQHKLSVKEAQGKNYPEEKQGMVTITIPLLLQRN